jgi:hypothetical protein
MNKIPRAFISGMLILSGSLSVFAGNLPSSQCLDSTGGAPALQVDVSTGNYSVSSDSNQFGGSQILVNGINVLQYSQPGFVGPDSRGFSRTVNNLQFTVDFTRGRGRWLGISLSVRNVGASEITLKSVQLLGSSYAQAFNGGSLSQLQMYTESFTPSNPDGAQPVPGQTVNSLYYAALFIPGYFRQNIPSSTTTPVLNTIGSFAATGSQTGRPFLKYFILDDGGT